jgi:hypothetical protein
MPTEWRFKAEYIKNCNCAMGCPCDFWATSTHGSCQGMFADRILQGHYGKVKLDGLIFGGTYHWPAACLALDSFPLAGKSANRTIDSSRLRLPVKFPVSLLSRSNP